MKHIIPNGMPILFLFFIFIALTSSTYNGCSDINLTPSSVKDSSVVSEGYLQPPSVMDGLLISS